MNNDPSLNNYIETNNSMKSGNLNSSGLDDIYKQQNITNNNRHFDQKRKNERDYEKLLKD